MKFVSSQAFPSNNVQWARSFGEEEANELNACMAIDSNDFYVVGGTVFRSDTGTSDAWVIKLGTDGKMMWNKFVGDTYHDEVNILDINNRNEIIGIGYTWLGQDSTSRESWIFKLGSDGQKLWSKKLGRFHVRCILTTGQGSIFLGGFAINDTSGSMHYAMMSLNEHGKRLWNRTYTGVGEIVGLSLSGDNRILVTGSRWRAKMDPRGYLLWESSFAGTDSIFRSVLLPRGEILYLGVRNRISTVLIKTGTDNNVIYEKEIKTTDNLSASASFIMSSPAQAIALMNFPDYQTLNWISPAQGVIQKMVRIPSGMTVTGLHTDLKGNLMLVAYSGEILLIKNSGITF